MKAYAVQTKPSDRDRDRLIADNIEVARRISLRMARRCPDWVSREDIVAAGMLGLAEAADRYDESRAEPFIAFAEKRIRGAVIDELRRGDVMPRRMRRLARQVGDAIQKLEQEHKDRDIAVIIPDLVLPHWYEGALHNNRGAFLRIALRARCSDRVVVITTPFHLHS